VSGAGTRTIYAEPLFWLGDNKELNMIGGWRGVWICRHCHTRLRDSTVGLPVLDGALRTLEGHQSLLRKFSRRGAEIGKSHGISGPSMLAKLANFNYIERIGQDHLMHDELEGNFRRHCLAIVQYLLSILGARDETKINEKWREFRNRFTYHGDRISTPTIAIRNKQKQDMTVTKLAFSGVLRIFRKIKQYILT